MLRHNLRTREQNQKKNKTQFLPFSAYAMWASHRSYVLGVSLVVNLSQVRRSGPHCTTKGTTHHHLPDVDGRIMDLTGPTNGDKTLCSKLIDIGFRHGLCAMDECNCSPLGYITRIPMVLIG